MDFIKLLKHKIKFDKLKNKNSTFNIFSVVKLGKFNENFANNWKDALYLFDMILPDKYIENQKQWVMLFTWN